MDKLTWRLVVLIKGMEPRETGYCSEPFSSRENAESAARDLRRFFPDFTVNIVGQIEDNEPDEEPETISKWETDYVSAMSSRGHNVYECGLCMDVIATISTFKQLYGLMGKS